MMTSDDALNLLGWLNENGIDVWVDGGWGVDALLGRQTRKHEDLDIAVRREANLKLRLLLEGKGYKEEPRFDSSAFMYVMKNEAGQTIDIHVFAYDENGSNTYGVAYPFGSLAGTGRIGGQEVNCIAPRFMFQFKTGYEPREKDLHDVQALSEKFGYELPTSYTDCMNFMILET